MVTTDDIAFMSVSELISTFERGDISPVEATRAALARIEAHNPRANAYSIVDPQSAVAAAQESERRWLKRQPKGRIDGVPLSVKDTLMLNGHPFRRGSLATGTTPAQESAPIVDHALREGAVILG
jgi:aspartyl-tRNA(Asn)/glutamyl-tRNA(Gln) amidotransferase subunit A